MKKIICKLLIVNSLLFVFVGCASSKVENTNKNEVGYYYYEVQNKTDKKHVVHGYLTSNPEPHPRFYSGKENIISETETAYIEPGESYVFKYPVYSECFITPIWAGLNFCPFAGYIITYGWEATCIPGIKTTMTFLDSNDTKARESSVEVADFVNYSDYVPKNSNGDFRYVVENQTDQDTYVMNMFVNKDDKIVYNTSWVKLPAGKSVEFKYKKSDYKGLYPMNVFWGINNFSAVKILKLEDFKAVKDVITGFDESGKPITSGYSQKAK